MQRALDFDKTLPLAVPLPFFLNIPFFALLAGALASWSGPALFTSRWTPATLALTHLWTLGILGSAMLGALLQILAVACNVRVTPTRLTAHGTQATLTAGTLFLAAGFLWQWSNGWVAASLLLAIAFGGCLLAVTHALWVQRQAVYPGAREILVPVRAALLALAITVLAGLALLGLLTQGDPLPSRWVNGHALWGLLGWGGLLVMGMSFQLLPIFQVTELFPPWLTHRIPWLILVLLVAWTILAAVAPRADSLAPWVEALLIASYLVWALVTWQRLRTRKRPKSEPTTLFWYLGLASLMGCCALGAVSTRSAGDTPVYAAGVLLIVGVLGSLINGMLYKIVPFLLWTHAQAAIVLPDDQRVLGRHIAKALPKMADYIPERHARWQGAAHTLVVASWVLAALGWGPAAHLAGPLLLISATGLAGNLVQGLWRYHAAQQWLASALQQAAALSNQA